MANHDPGQVFSPGGSQETATPPAPVAPEQQTVAPQEAAQPYQLVRNDQSTPEVSTDVQTEATSASPSPAETTPTPYQPETISNYAPLTASEPTPQSTPTPQPVSSTENEPVPSPYALQDDDTQPATDDNEVITWTASEYIAHQKTPTWYIVLGFTTLALAALTYLMTSGDIVSVVVVILVMVVFGMYAARKPQEQEYTVSQAGIAIGQKGYPYTELKSFSVVDEGAFSSIVFIPMKRFMPVLTMYYDPQDEERIFATLSRHLPHEQNGHDRIDRFMKKIRF